MSEERLGAGWGFPANSQKAHYFPDDDPTMALCRRYGLFRGERFDELHDHQDNCKECRRIRNRRARQGDTGQPPVESHP